MISLQFTKWEITGKVDFEKTADYSLFSVLAGQGQLTVDGKIIQSKR